MIDFQGRRRQNSWFYSKLTILILLVLVLLMSRAVFDVYQKNRVARENFYETEKKLNELESEKLALESSVASLSTKLGVEKEIRKNFSVVKEGERLITIIENQKDIPATNTDKQSSSWWKVLKGVFLE